MPDSKSQVRWAHAVLEGNASGDKAFAREVVDKMHGRKMSSLPERLGRVKKMADGGVVVPNMVRPSPMLPRPYDVEKDVQHLEHVRPVGMSVGIAIDKAMRSEGNIANPMGSGPRGNPSILRRLKIGTAAPKIQQINPRLAALQPRGIRPIK